MSNTKQPTLLITTSILDAFGWYRRCPPSWRKRAHADLVAKIRRERYEPHVSAQRGIEFEDAIYEQKTGGSAQFKRVSERCSGGIYQRVMKETIQVNGRDVLLYCKSDVLFPDVKLIDIKTTENYRGDDKYLQGWQHKLYLYVAGLSEFEYVVVMFDKFPSNTIVDHYVIPYTNDNPNELLKEIKAGIWDFYEWLVQEELFYDYEQIFSNARRKR